MRQTIYLLAILTLTLSSCFSETGRKSADLPALVTSVKSDDIDQFNKLVDGLSNIDTLVQDDDAKITLMGLACRSGSAKVANRLIELNASIKDCAEDDIYSYDALILAIEGGNVALVQLILSKNVDVNGIYDENGLTPLVMACKINNYEISKLLIESGANVDGAGDTGGDYIYFPIFESILNDNFELTKLILVHGAKTDVADKQGTTIKKLLESDPQIDHRIADLVLKQ